MNKVLKVNFAKRKKLTSLLGLSLDGSKLEGVVLKRTNGSLQQQQTFSVTLSLDPLTAAVCSLEEISLMFDERWEAERPHLSAFE